MPLPPPHPPSADLLTSTYIHYSPRPLNGSNYNWWVRRPLVFHPWSHPSRCVCYLHLPVTGSTLYNPAALSQHRKLCRIIRCKIDVLLLWAAGVVCAHLSCALVQNQTQPLLLWEQCSLFISCVTITHGSHSDGLNTSWTSTSSKNFTAGSWKSLAL